MRNVIFLLSIFFFASCHQPATKNPDDFDYGKIDNGKYDNQYFDFSIPVPGNWVVQNKEQVAQLRKIGEDAIGSDNTALKERIKAAAVQTAVLLTVFKHRTDSVTRGFNPSFIILSENLGNSGVTKPDDYLRHAGGLMKQSNMNYEFSPDFESEKIGNRDFERMDVSLTTPGDTIKQSYYSRVDKKFAFSIIISYDNDKDRSELKEIINKINFR